MVEAVNLIWRNIRRGAFFHSTLSMFMSLSMRVHMLPPRATQFQFYTPIFQSNNLMSDFLYSYSAVQNNWVCTHIQQKPSNAINNISKL